MQYLHHLLSVRELRLQNLLHSHRFYVRQQVLL